MTTGETPRTEAGRALLDDPHGTAGIIDAWGGDDLRHAILAIEREAAADPPEPPRPDHAEAADALMAALQENGGPYDEDATQDAIDVLAEHGFEVRPLAAPEGLSLDVDVLGFSDLLDVADALLRRYPPDTIVCSHHVKADPGAKTAAAIADLIASARLSPSSGESGSPPEPFDSQARELLEACHERNIHSRGDMEYQFQPWAIDENRLFEALSFLGEDDILADGSLWKIKEIALNAVTEYNKLGSGSPGEDR